MDGSVSAPSSAADRMGDGAESPHVVHLTSCHAALDNRVFWRECRSLEAAGYRVTVIGVHPLDESVDGVEVQAAPAVRGRVDRLLRQGWRLFRRALRTNAQVYHVHDPDLLPWAVLLRLVSGRPVVYDVHEDYVTALACKPYLPRGLGWLAGHLYGGLERLATTQLEVVIAERSYARRFPGATPVLNFPEPAVVERLLAIPRQPPTDGTSRLLYTGTVAVIRGAFLMADLASSLPRGGSLSLIGTCDPEIARGMRQLCPDPTKLRLEGEGGRVPFERIVAAYGGPWTAGLALFPDTPHMRGKELTKFFEYMAAGLPIICSDFPVWRELVEGSGAGICVDPADPQAVRDAVARLAAEPDLARAMGEAGRAAVRTRFAWTGEARRLVALYQRLAPLPAGASVASRDRARRDGHSMLLPEGHAH